MEAQKALEKAGISGTVAPESVVEKDALNGTITITTGNHIQVVGQGIGAETTDYQVNPLLGTVTITRKGIRTVMGQPQGKFEGANRVGSGVDGAQYETLPPAVASAAGFSYAVKREGAQSQPQAAEAGVQ